MTEPTENASFVWRVSGDRRAMKLAIRSAVSAMNMVTVRRARWVIGAMIVHRCVAQAAHIRDVI